MRSDGVLAGVTAGEVARGSGTRVVAPVLGPGVAAGERTGAVADGRAGVVVAVRVGAAVVVRGGGAAAPPRVVGKVTVGVAGAVPRGVVDPAGALAVGRDPGRTAPPPLPPPLAPPLLSAVESSTTSPPYPVGFSGSMRPALLSGGCCMRASANAAAAKITPTATIPIPRRVQRLRVSAAPAAPPSTGIGRGSGMSGSGNSAGVSHIGCNGVA